MAGSRKNMKVAPPSEGHMTRKDSLHLLVRQAHANGFEFRRWYQKNVAPEWPGAEEAVALLDAESRYFALIFSHDFARAFWKPGAQMNFVIPSTTYSRMNGKGQVVTINRKPFTRRTIKADVWKYHLQKLATSEDPFRYLDRFLPSQDWNQSLQSAAESLPATG